LYTHLLKNKLTFPKLLYPQTGESMSAFLLMAVDAEIERQRRIIDAGLESRRKQSPA
jgi:hypothetical protein